MPVLNCVCPYCHAALRLRDVMTERRFDCPDCGQPVRLAVEGEGAFAAVKDVPVAPAKSTAAAANPSAFAPPIPQSTFPASRWPQLIAGSVAALCLIVLTPFLVMRMSSHAKPPVEPDNKPPAAAVAAKAAEKPVPAPAAVPDTPEQRLKVLWAAIKADVATSGQFPRGTVPGGELPAGQRLSWLARLEAAQHPQANQPLWDHGWHDPRNDPFVRRRVGMFQNPAVKEATGADGYPASHFVGVTGIGPDAARLPASDPRAGIFGQDRVTRVEDVKDGLSETILVAGVQQHLGSWGAGASTLRGFTREPYVNGPDGFGTGQADSMLVLMADGSVRTVAAKTDPRVIESLAAITDEFLNKPPPVIAQNDPPAVPPAQENVEPDEAPPALPVVKIDLAAALSQQVLAFDQPKPAPLEQLLVQVESLAGVPIQFDRAQLGENGNKLDTPVSVRLEKVSVEEILKALLDQAGLTFRLEEDRVRIVPADS